MRYFDPIKDTPEGKLLSIVRDIEKAVGITKNMTCMNCEDTENGCPSCNPNKPKDVKKEVRNKDKADLDDDGKLSGYEKKRGKAIEAAMGEDPLKADMSEKDEYCKKHFGCKYSECSAEQKAQCDRECGKVAKSDPTSDFIQKYIQERSGDNVKPMFMEISGKTEIPASGYQGNQHLPYTEDASESKAVSEVFKMPSVAQTGYDANASSLHMHYNDGGTGGSMYRDKVEESLATIKKEANAGQLGLIEEIAGKIEQLYARL